MATKITKRTRTSKTGVTRSVTRTRKVGGKTIRDTHSVTTPRRRSK